MKEFTIDENGVPSLSANDIEKKAEEVIEFFDPKILHAPCETPLLSFVQETANKYNVLFDSSQDLGNNLHGHKVVGKFCFKPQAILVDKSITEDDPRQKFILGHEFGHLVLHRKLLIKKKNYTDINIADTEKDLVTGKKILSTPRDWLEWQANRFSNAIITPRATFINALIEVQKSLDIHKNVGHIYLDDQPVNFQDFQQILEKLKNIYHVSKKNIEVRLNELGLLIDVRGKNTQHISELFMEE